MSNPETTDPEWPQYRFRWSNIDLDSYVDGRKAKAAHLRRQAADLILQASAIEEEAAALKTDLSEVKNDART